MQYPYIIDIDVYNSRRSTNKISGVGGWNVGVSCNIKLNLLAMFFLIYYFYPFNFIRNEEPLFPLKTDWKCVCDEVNINKNLDQHEESNKTLLAGYSIEK